MMAFEIDKQSSTWLAVSAAVAEKIEYHRAANDEPSLDVVLTEQHRGAIAVLKEILALGDPLAPAGAKRADEDNYGLGV